MQKKKSGVKKCLEICLGGVGRLMANAILNFHFDYLKPSLSVLSILVRVLGHLFPAFCLFVMNTNDGKLQICSCLMDDETNFILAKTQINNNLFKKRIGVDLCQY